MVEVVMFLHSVSGHHLAVPTDCLTERDHLITHSSSSMTYAPLKKKMIQRRFDAALMDRIAKKSVERGEVLSRRGYFGLLVTSHHTEDIDITVNLGHACHYFFRLI